MLSKALSWIEKYKMPVTKLSQDIKYSTGNTVNNIVITMYGARGY